MVTQTDVGHGRGWLAPAPAASLARIDRELGSPLPTSSLGRTAAEQQALIDAAAAGDPNVFMPAAVGKSPHQWGISADVPRYWLYEAVMNRHGWFRPLPKADPVHFNYDANRDTHRNDPNPEEEMNDEDRKRIDSQLKVLTDAVARLLNAVGDPNIGITNTAFKAATKAESALAAINNAEKQLTTVTNLLTDKERGVLSKLDKIASRQ